MIDQYDIDRAYKMLSKVQQHWEVQDHYTARSTEYDMLVTAMYTIAERSTDPRAVSVASIALESLRMTMTKQG